jgi:hypothetical protein
MGVDSTTLECVTGVDLMQIKPSSIWPWLARHSLTVDNFLSFRKLSIVLDIKPQSLAATIRCFLQSKLAELYAFSLQLFFPRGHLFAQGY